MLRGVNKLQNYTIQATDGEIGSVYDALLDDEFWILRYLVMDTARWLPGRKVLLTPAVLGKPDWEQHHLPVKLSREQVKNSPDVDSDKSVSRQREMELHTYYGWPFYWGVPDGLPFSLEPPLHMPPPPAKEQSNEHGDPHLRSVRELRGYGIQASDGEIGHVDDFIVDDETWDVRYMGVATTNWLPGRKVLISPEASPTAALVVTLASAVVYVRILIIAGAVAPQMLPGIAGPIGAMLAFTALTVVGAWLASRKSRLTMSLQGNPAELKSALIFGAIFVVVLVAVPAAKQYFGTRGFYAVSAFSGLVDVDAITLSTLQRGQKEQSDPNLAWRVILVASLANLVFKGAAAGFLGSRRFFARTAVLFSIAVAAGIFILWLWPEAKNATLPNADATPVENAH